MDSFSWLHLTDLHLGMKGQPHLWPNVRGAFFDNLAELHKRCGPWDVVLFTGDLVQKGSQEEFQRLDAEVFGPLWERLNGLGSRPILLGVPGNHDLVRPGEAPEEQGPPTAAERVLIMRGCLNTIGEEFWTDSASEYRQVIDKAFKYYSPWWRNLPYAGDATIRQGILPGDFSVTWETAKRLQIGIVGLNSTFLQLAAGDYKGRLALDVRQLQAICDGDAGAWTRRHDACLLLTHQGPDWLNERSRNDVYPEINPAGRFAVHLFGHMHDNVIRSTSSAGGPMVRHWQGCSLFGMEHYGEAQEEKRRHGYSAGRLEFKKTVGHVRHWPRRAVKDANGWRFVPDHEGCVLKKDEGTAAEEIEWKPTKKKRPTELPPPAGPDVFAKRALLAYRQALLRSCDILDLSGLPEYEVARVLEKFRLRNLYVPLRIQVPVRADQIDEACFAELESRRERQRLREAGRGESGKKLPTHRTQPLGNRLDAVRRLVVLGDPGTGKTTLLRWMATAYLLRLALDPAREKLPDVKSLPIKEWLPVLVRCRELDPQQLSRITLDDILDQAVRKLEIPERRPRTDEVVEALRARLAEGRALLLVDGLDEITDPALRGRFCEQIDTIARQYAQTPLVVTSRIPGYREMHRRLDPSFELTTIAPLEPEDKDQFVEQWCQVTEPADRRQATQEELIRSIHSVDRIERFTGNPMLLTTLALVKRRVGKLPNHRHELYREAVEVLLTWRAHIGERLEERNEALPQLQYVAYAMCDRGVLKLRGDEVLNLLERMRCEYTHIRDLERHSPEDFLRIVEERAGLLAQSGEVRHEGQMVPVYEFRHLTFQEYLAALALVQGRYPGHRRGTPLAQRVAPLAGRLEEEGDDPQITENWREVLRLCVASCNEDDVDDVLRAIMEPAEHEDPQRTARARAVLAALCLSDEPNVKRTTALEVLRKFGEQIRQPDGIRDVRTGAEQAAMELGHSHWKRFLQDKLVAEFMTREPSTRHYAGGVSAMVSGRSVPNERDALGCWTTEQVSRISSKSDAEAIEGALAVMEASYSQGLPVIPGLVNSLFNLLDRGNAAAHAAAWALAWLQGMGRSRGTWEPNSAERARIIAFLSDPSNDPVALEWLASISAREHLSEATEDTISVLRRPQARSPWFATDALAEIRDPGAVEPLAQCLKDQEAESGVRQAAAVALGNIGGARAVEALGQCLKDQEAGTDVRQAASKALGNIGGARSAEALGACLPERHDILLPLQYVAYAMCHQGVQQLRRDELLKLLERMRGEYTHIRPLERHSPEDFLGILEERTSLLIQSGDVRHQGQIASGYEFCHLTFQHYLAALALIQGRYPGHQRDSTLAQRVAPLAARLEERGDDPQVTQNWREVLRLCVASCSDDDVDDVLRAIVELAEGEDPQRTARPRAILAALCLSDEPNVSAQIAQHVLLGFVNCVRADADQEHPTRVDRHVVSALCRSRWIDTLKQTLLQRFLKGSPEIQSPTGVLCFEVIDKVRSTTSSGETGPTATRLVAGSELTRLEEALFICNPETRTRPEDVPQLVSALLQMIGQSSALDHAASWALWRLMKESKTKIRDSEITAVVTHLQNSMMNPEALMSLLWLVRDCTISDALSECVSLLKHPYGRTRKAAARALGEIRDARAVEALMKCLTDKDAQVRQAALAALARIRGDETDMRLLSRDVDGVDPWRDPQETIPIARMKEAARALGLPLEDVRRRYEALADEYGLTLE